MHSGLTALCEKEVIHTDAFMNDGLLHTTPYLNVCLAHYCVIAVPQDWHEMYWLMRFRKVILVYPFFSHAAASCSLETLVLWYGQLASVTEFKWGLQL